MNTKIKNTLFTALMFFSVNTALPMENLVRVKELHVLYDSGNLNSMQFVGEKAFGLIDSDVALLEKNSKDVLKKIDDNKSFTERVIAPAIDYGIGSVFGATALTLWSSIGCDTYYFLNKSISIKDVDARQRYHVAFIKGYWDSFTFISMGAVISSFIAKKFLQAAYYSSKLDDVELMELNKVLEKNLAIIGQLRTIKASL